VQIEMDDDGMRVDLLEQTLDRLEREGRRPKFVYTVPTFQNPAGVTMALDRRRRLVSLAKQRELLVLEDNPYGLLRYEGDPLRSSTFGQHFVCAYFAQRNWADLLGRLRELYRHRRDVLLEALEEHFPAAAEWTRPAGGLFIWATLPDYIDTTDLLARALRDHVAFVPGRAAYLDGRGGSAMRLNFSGVGEDDLREGVRRIGKVIAEQVQLYSTLTGAPPAPPRRAPEEPVEEEAGSGARIVPLRRRAGG
jgi:2-aminoadipate transaminase